jgi:hypothetical protein
VLCMYCWGGCTIVVPKHNLDKLGTVFRIRILIGESCGKLDVLFEGLGISAVNWESLLNPLKTNCCAVIEERYFFKLIFFPSLSH